MDYVTVGKPKMVDVSLVSGKTEVGPSRNQGVRRHILPYRPILAVHMVRPQRSNGILGDPSNRLRLQTLDVVISDICQKHRRDNQHRGAQHPGFTTVFKPPILLKKITLVHVDMAQCAQRSMPHRPFSLENEFLGDL